VDVCVASRVCSKKVCNHLCFFSPPSGQCVKSIYTFNTVTALCFVPEGNGYIVTGAGVCVRVCVFGYVRVCVCASVHVCALVNVVGLWSSDVCVVWYAIGVIAHAYSLRTCCMAPGATVARTVWGDSVWLCQRGGPGGAELDASLIGADM